MNALNKVHAAGGKQKRKNLVQTARRGRGKLVASGVRQGRRCFHKAHGPEGKGL